MLEAYKTLIADQLEAALCTLDRCVDRCPTEVWDAPVGNLAFCQVAFHTLFFADCLLGQDTETMRQQPFHREHADFFRDYEELEDRKQMLLYDRLTIRVYLSFCREKGSAAIAAENADTLGRPVSFKWMEMKRAELYVYLIRHIQHHAAQLSLRLRLHDQTDIPWIKSGWEPA